MSSNEPGDASQDGRDEDDEEDYEEADGGNRLLGFMFGNVDNSGDLDVDYLDEDAKEHIDALADKLGTSLTDIDLSTKSLQTKVDASQQDYGAKNEDAVDYEDFDEQYEGPEVQADGEEDYLLPKKEYLSSEISLVTLAPMTTVFDDENYDEEEEDRVELDKDVSGDKILYVQVTEEESPVHDCTQLDTRGSQSMISDLEGPEEGKAGFLEEPPDGKGSTPLPVLCIEDGVVILRFSEIFGIHDSLKIVERRDNRYSVFKGKYISMDVSDIVEEDEEAFLKGFSQIFQFQPDASQYDISVFDDDDLESWKFGVMQGFVQNEELQKSFISSEPMNTDLSINFSAEWQSPLCSKFHPLDQQDWEYRIIWDNSPAVSGNSVESFDISEHELVDSFIKETELASHTNESQLKLPQPLEGRDQNCFLHSSPVCLESFASADVSGSSDSPLESRCHPQLLRLESLIEAAKDHHVDGEDSNYKDTLTSDAFRRFSKLTLQNRDIMEGSWLNDIIWESDETNVIKPELILDLQDEQMLFEVLDDQDGKSLQVHAGAMIITQSLKPRVSSELSAHRCESGWQFNIANDKFYMNRKISNSSKHSAYGAKVYHSAPAIKLQTMKLKLSNKDLANFHRPKALWHPHDSEVALKEQKKLPTQGPMKIILKSLGGKGSKLHVGAEETISSVKTKGSKKLDLKPLEKVKIFYLGKELDDSQSLAVQNVQPNSLLHLIRTRIHLLPRAQKISGENEFLRPPGAFKKKSDLSVKDGHIFLMEYCEERPLLLSNVGMGANLCTYYQKSSATAQAGVSLCHGNNSLGNVVVLEPTDKSPFLGDITAGCFQSSIETNIYKAPIFSHKVASTDYLLVRSAKGKLSVRRIDQIAVVGQQVSEPLKHPFEFHHQEPLMEVFSPSSKNLRAYITNRLLVDVYRKFRAAEKRGAIPWIRADELSAQFPNLSEAILRKKLKESSILKKDANGHLFWSKQPDFVIPSEEELKKLVLPENVCAYESMLAGLYRLKHLGITKLTLPTSVSTSMSQLADVAITLAAASRIERELQITPWSLSRNFVACTNQITKHTRRHRIAMIRKLSIEQASSGVKVDPTTISKHARGHQMSYLQLQQQTREKCQEIWDRQVQSLSAVDGDEIERDSEANSDLDSFAGDLENLLDAEEFEGDENNYESKHDKVKIRRCPSQAQAEEEIEDEADEAADLCRLLMDDEAEQKKKKKPKLGLGESGFTPVESMLGNKMFNKVKNIKKIATPDFGANQIKAKVKILGDGLKGFEEKKSTRESFVCGACSQLGHMRTNKDCPKYGEHPETKTESNAFSGKSNSLEPSAKSHYKIMRKKKSRAKPEVSEPEKSSLKEKVVVAIKFKKFKPIGKVNKIKISNKSKLEDVQQVDSHKPSIVIRPPDDTDGSHYESQKPSIIIQPPANTERDFVDSPKPSIVMRPPAAQDHKKLVIKQPKVFIDLDTGFEYQKMNKIAELSGVDRQQEPETSYSFGESTKKKIWEREEDEWKKGDFLRLEDVKKSSRREQEEDELQKGKKMKKKMKPDISDDYLEDYRAGRTMPERDRGTKRHPVVELPTFSAEQRSSAKRRRGGEVGLANILESIIDTLRSRSEVSYLFLKPVLKKEAPDYLQIVKRPMDLSTIRDKARNMGYRNRDKFRYDVWQIMFNAHLYNEGRNPGIPPLADQLLKLCDYLLKEHSHSLSAAESGIEP